MSRLNLPSFPLFFLEKHTHLIPAIDGAGTHTARGCRLHSLSLCIDRTHEFRHGPSAVLMSCWFIPRVRLSYFLPCDTVKLEYPFFSCPWKEKGLLVYPWNHRGLGLNSDRLQEVEVLLQIEIAEQFQNSPTHTASSQNSTAAPWSSWDLKASFSFCTFPVVFPNMDTQALSQSQCQGIRKDVLV